MQKRTRKVQGKQSAAKQAPAKKPLVDKRLLIGTVTFGVVVVLLSYCMKEPPVSQPQIRQVSPAAAVAPVEQSDGSDASEQPAAGDSPAAEAEEATASGGVTVRFKTPIIRSGPGVEVLAEGSGADGSPLTFEYEWRINREPVPDVTGTVLPWEKVKRGDRISLQVTPLDGDVPGKPLVTEEIVLPNSPPQFVSTPMLNFKAEEYIYEAKAEDADHDPLTYALEAGPEGMAIDKASGRLTWRIGRDQAGDHVIKLVVADSEGARAVQEYTLSVTIP